MTQIYIVEDHPVVREMLTVLVSRIPDTRVCGSADSAADALEEVPGSESDLVLVDVSMPDMDGIELVQRLATACPGLKTLMVSGHEEAVYADRALAAGARGYYVKGSDVPLATAIQTVIDGKVYRAPEMADAVKR